MGTLTTKTETGLSCGTSYTRYAWAYCNCTHSNTPVSMTETTIACWDCGDNLTIVHVADTVAPVSKTVTYGTVTGINGAPTKCWITSNLGSDHQADSVDDPTEASAGWYWQFNLSQGYKHDDVGRTPNTTWNYNISVYSDWIAVEDPCTLELGTGWRLPTSTEYNLIDASGAWSNWNGPWNSLLKMHAAGKLDWGTGVLGDRGAVGSYWSATQSNASMAFDLNFYANACGNQLTTKSFGYSIRCLKD